MRDFWWGTIFCIYLCSKKREFFRLALFKVMEKKNNACVFDKNVGLLRTFAAIAQKQMHTLHVILVSFNLLSLSLPTYQFFFSLCCFVRSFFSHIFLTKTIHSFFCRLLALIIIIIIIIVGCVVSSKATQTLLDWCD